MEVALQLQANQIQYARHMIEQAQATPVAAAAPSGNTEALSGVILDLSAAAQQLLGG